MGNGRQRRTKCVGVKADGTRCGAYPLKGKKLCSAHAGKAGAAQRKGGRVTGAKSAKLKAEKDKQRHKLAAGGLKINDWEDLKALCEKNLTTCPPQFSSWWLGTLTKCIERLADQNVVHYIVFVDPLLPHDPVPPLPELPGFDFAEIKDPDGPE